MSVITKKQGQLEYLVAEGITVPHCFTTRLGGVSEGYLSSLNIGLHRGDDPKNVQKGWKIHFGEWEDHIDTPFIQDIMDPSNG